MRKSAGIAALAAAGLMAAGMAAPASAAKPDWAKKSDASIVETAIALSTQEDRPAGVFDEVADDFDILVRALLATGVAGIFDGTDYTVFAPTDQAFIDTADALTPETTVDSEQEAFDVVVGLGVPAVSNILAYHVTDGVRNSRSVTKAKKITMLNGGTISARGPKGSEIKAANSKAGFVATDVRVSDGMIHVIDNVLLP